MKLNIKQITSILELCAKYSVAAVKISEDGSLMITFGPNGAQAPVKSRAGFVPATQDDYKETRVGDVIWNLQPDAGESL